MGYLPLEITLYGWSMILTLLFCLWLTFKIGKRKVNSGKGGIGCLGFVYVFSIVSIVTGLTLGLTLGMGSKIYADVTLIVQGDYYDAKIVSFESHRSRGSGSSQTMYTPIVEFQTPEGERIVHRLSYSSSSVPEVGDRVFLFYNPKTNEAVSFGFITMVLFFGSCLILVVLLYVLWGILLYATNSEMRRYYQVIKFVGICIVIPVVMIFFEGLLIYALFYGNKVPWYISFVLGFFILILMFGIWGYIKMIQSNDIKWVRTGVGSWSGVAVPKESNAKRKGNSLIKRK